VNTVSGVGATSTHFGFFTLQWNRSTSPYNASSGNAGCAPCSSGDAGGWLPYGATPYRLYYYFTYDGDPKCSPPTEHIGVVPKVCLIQSEAKKIVGWIGRKDSEDRSGDDASPASCTPDERGRMQRRK